MTGSRLISTTQDLVKLLDECISGAVLPPSRVHFGDESGSRWDTTDGALITISSLWLLQELSQSQLQSLLQWIFFEKFPVLSLDLTLLRGPRLSPHLLLQQNHLTWTEIFIHNVLSHLNLQSSVILLIPKTGR